MKKNDWSDPYSIKIDYSLAPPEFDDVILVLQQAAESGKYGRNDWLNGINFDSDRNYSSSMRHWREKREGVTKDKESGLHPLLHVACRALMEYTLDRRQQKEMDDWEQASLDDYGDIFDDDIDDYKEERKPMQYTQAQLAGMGIAKVQGFTMHPQHCECNVCCTYRKFTGTGER